jgi:hypothetical protein
MAKVDGPLMSISARGQIAKSIVFFPWKGRNVVRQWLKPTQPNSTKQGHIRAAMYAIGKAVKKIQSISQGDAVDSQLYQYLTSNVAAGLNWNAWLPQGLLKLCQTAGTFLTANFLGLITEFSDDCGTDEQAFFAEKATSLGMVDFAFNYGYVTNIPAGCQLYLLARACYAESVHNSAPYDTIPHLWDTDDIGSFADDLTTA